MGLLGFLRKRKSPLTVEERRLALLDKGRVTDGVILESEINEDGEELVRYSYLVHGVEFVSSDFLIEEQKVQQQKYAPGASVSVRYDPRNHSNAILV